MKFTVVTVKRIRADYVVEAADARDAWNRVCLLESTRGLMESGAICTRESVEIEPERFIVAAEVPARHEMVRVNQWGLPHDYVPRCVCGKDWPCGEGKGE